VKGASPDIRRQLVLESRDRNPDLSRLGNRVIRMGHDRKAQTRGGASRNEDLLPLQPREHLTWQVRIMRAASPGSR